jgi:hypothetical protein
MSASRTTKSEKQSKPIFDGRLNLEQQRKRAKELLGEIKRHDPTATARVEGIAGPFDLTNIQLTDTQLVIARENGFASWPKMKKHIDQIAERNRQISSGTPPALDTAKTLHLRCGSDIRHGLEIAGFVGAFFEFADPFCQGPVPDVSLEQFVQIRAEFIASSYQITLKDALARSQREYGTLTTLGEYDHVVLWFEHDSYDQLILAFLMDFISATRPDTTIEVISVNAVPGIDRFIGLGQLSPELLIWCWENQRIALSNDMLSYGRDAWQAIRSDTPDKLQAIIAKPIGPLPHMKEALARHLAELPEPTTGLGLTQKLTLQILADHGPITVGKVFGHLMRSYDPLPYLGDLMFRADLKTMLECSDPPFTISPTPPHENWAECIITLTETGKNILAGKQSFLETFHGTRWVGGITV